MKNGLVGLALLGVVAAIAVAPLPDSPASTPTSSMNSASPIPEDTSSERSGSASVSCPQPAYVNGDGVSDGCSAASSKGSYQKADFFTTAPQSGQRYNVRPGWNVAGVDYAVGYDTTLHLKDPATAALPTGCAYLPGGRSGVSRYPTVDCSGAAGFNLDGWDFSGASSSGRAAGGIMLMLEADLGGTCTITNNRFASGSNQHTNVFGPSPLIFATSSTTGCNLDLEHNDFNGGWPEYGDDQSLIINNFGSNAVYQYNAFHDAPGRALTTGGRGCPSLQWRYNAIANVGMVPYADNHGEEWADFVGANCTLDHLNSDFNTLSISAAVGPVQGGPVQSVRHYGNLAALIFGTTTNLSAGNTIQVSGLLPASFDGTFTVTRVSGRNVYYKYPGSTYQSGAAIVNTAGQWTAPFFLSSGAGLNDTVTMATVNNNTTSGNGFAGQSKWAQIQSAIVNIGYAAITTLELKDNYADCTGSLWAMYNQAQVDTGLSGVIADGVIAFNPLASGPVKALAGAWLYGPGITPTQVLANSIGTQVQLPVGSYASSIIQSASFTGGALNTAIGSQTISGNVNLVTGNPITAGGFDLKSGVCEGHS